MRNFALILLITLLSLSMTACKKSPKAPVKIGVILPFSGDFKIYGDMGIMGIKMAVAEINAAGGLLGGRQLELIVKDNKTSPAESVRLARQMIEKDKVIAIIGPVSSTSRNALLEIAREFKTPLLYGIDYEGGSYDRYLFCYSPIPEHYVNPVIPYLMNLHGNSVYVFGYDYIWPHEMYRAIENSVNRHGGKIAGVEYTPFGVKDYSKSIERIAKSGAKILALVLPGVGGFDFLKHFEKLGLKKKVSVLAIAANESYLKALPPNVLEGVYTGIQFVASSNRKQTVDFIERNKKFFKEEGNDKNNIVTYATDSHYGLVKLLADSIKITGSLNKENLIDNMEGMRINSGSGIVTMRKDHHMDLNMFLARYTDGKLLVIKEFGLISPSDQRSNREKK